MNILPQKIMFVSHGTALGGSPISCLKLIKGIDKNIFTPIFAYREYGSVVDLIKKEGVISYEVGQKGFLGLAYILHFYKIMTKEKVALVHLNTLTSYYKYAAIAAYLKKLPIVWFIREDPQAKRCRKLKFWIKNLATKIVPVSYDISNNLPFTPKNGNVKVIHNGVDLDEFQPKDSQFLKKLYSLPENERLAGTIASLEERKGIEYLIRAIPSVKEEVQGFKVIITGEDRTSKKKYLQKLQELVIELGCERDIIFTGALTNINEVLNSLDIFILPTLWEGLARTILEAMACAKPVIATNAGGNRELIIDGDNGLLIPLQSSEAISKAIICLLKDDHLRHEMGKKARSRAEREFSVQRYVRGVEELYLSLLV
ncbi:MAG: glycosyltransferase family 4 protein [bacterium]